MSTELNVDVYKPATDVTGRATAPVNRKRLVRIAGNMDAGLVTLAPTTAGGRAFGVARNDAATGELVSVARGAGRIVKITAAAAIAAGAEVDADAAGQVTAHTTGIAIGYAVTAAAAGADAFVSLYA